MNDDTPNTQFNDTQIINNFFDNINLNDNTLSNCTPYKNKDINLNDNTHSNYLHKTHTPSIPPLPSLSQLTISPIEMHSPKHINSHTNIHQNYNRNKTDKKFPDKTLMF